jgi:hypothetical protein
MSTGLWDEGSVSPRWSVPPAEFADNIIEE